MSFMVLKILRLFKNCLLTKDGSIQESFKVFKECLKVFKEFLKVFKVKAILDPLLLRHTFIVKILKLPCPKKTKSL